MVANVPTARVWIKWLTPQLLTREDARLDVLAAILAGRHTAWLSWDLVNVRGVAVEVTARQCSHDLAWFGASRGPQARSAGEFCERSTPP